MNSTQIFGTFRKSPYICSGEILQIMLVLQDCIGKLSEFKQTFGSQFGITKLGIFGSVARQENTEDSDIDIVVEVEKPTLSLMYELRENSAPPSAHDSSRTSLTMWSMSKEELTIRDRLEDKTKSSLFLQLMTTYPSSKRQ